MSQRDLLVLIDGNSLINRAFYAIAPLNARDGTPTNALFGFVNMMVKMIVSHEPSRLAVVFDRREPTFRHLRYDGYKATRKGMPDDLACQMPLLKELLAMMRIRCFECAGFEADDIIGTIATREAMPTVIVTGDKDALQLVSESTTVHLTKRGISDVEVFTPEHFREVYGMEPKRIIDLKSLMGDSSDNIPGVRGIGEKTAFELLHTYGTLEGVYEHLDELKGAVNAKLQSGRESAFLSYELATIRLDAPVEYSIDDLRYDFPFSEAVRNKFEAYAFRSLAARSSLFSEGPSETEQQEAHVELRIVHADELSEIDFSHGFSFLYTGAELRLAVDTNTEFCIRFGGDLLNEGDSEERVFAALPELSDPAVPKTAFDYKAQKHALDRVGAAVKGVTFDVQLAQYVADCTRPNATLGAILDGYGLSAYTEYPASALLKLKEALTPLVEPMSRVFYEIEMPVAEVLYKMEKSGFLIDTAELDQAGVKLAAQSEVLAGEIFALAGHEFNIRSPRQIGQVLFEEMGLSAGKKTKQQAFSTSADVLETLRGEPIVDAILRYRFVTKLYSTYVEGLRKLVGADGVVHTEFKQTVTTTGRLSSVEPNLQNIPVRDEEGKLLRRMFVARPGRLLVSADYSQIELRLMAHFSEEPGLIDAYRRGEDIHTATASQVFGVPLEEVTPAMRRDAKAVNFGVIYGISDYGLSQNLGIPLARARKYILGYFMRYPKVKEYLDAQVAAAHRDGKLASLTGRVRRFENINSSNFRIRSFNERAAMNMPLQSTAADLIKLAMIRVDRALAAEGLRADILLQVHDELILEADERDVLRVGELLKREMEGAMALRVPLAASVTVGKTWFDL